MALSLAGDGTLSGVDIAGSGLGRVLQVVRATDSTDRTTTSTSYVDVPGMSVTITPQKADSSIVIIACFSSLVEDASSTRATAYYRIADASNNAINGAEESEQTITVGNSTSVLLANAVTLRAYSTPATTAATTYKLQFRHFSATTLTVQNAENTGQMYAIEVAA